jgi:hypothetical protein
MRKSPRFTPRWQRTAPDLELVRPWITADNCRKLKYQHAGFEESCKLEGKDRHA